MDRHSGFAVRKCCIYEIFHNKYKLSLVVHLSVFRIETNKEFQSND